MPYRFRIRGYLFQYVWFSWKPSLTRNLNHSNWIRNEQVMAKIRTLVKIEKQSTTCTGTTPRILPKMCVFLPFFYMLIPKSTQYFLYTSKSLQIHLEISILFNSSFITYLSSKIFHEFLPKTTLIWVITHTQTKHED